MKIKQALAETAEMFSDNEIESAFLESEVLARHALGVDRARLYTVLDQDIEPAAYRLLSDYAAKRLKGEPSSYITSHREFYGLDFFVDRRVLVPRPETELMVDRVRELTAGMEAPVIADIGTGSGCIAIALARTIPGSFVYAIDISNDCLEVADINCKTHGVSDRIRLLRGDLLDPLPGRVDIITANLPYVKSMEIAPGQAEPRLALEGGNDGLDQVRRLVMQASRYLEEGATLFVEIGQGQEYEITSYIGHNLPGSEITGFRDLAGIFRLVQVSFNITAAAP